MRYLSLVVAAKNRFVGPDNVSVSRNVFVEVGHRLTCSYIVKIRKKKLENSKIKKISLLTGHHHKPLLLGYNFFNKICTLT